MNGMGREETFAYTFFYEGKQRRESFASFSDTKKNLPVVEIHVYLSLNTCQFYVIYLVARALRTRI